MPSAILKYHCTEYGRRVGNDAMDVHGGKAIMMGPNNYMGRAYMAAPIGITVEGANILTRSLIIYGQGAMRCHPFVLRELQAAQDEDHERGLAEFDDALFGHIGYGISNLARSFFLALTHAKFSRVPLNTPTRRYYQNINRYMRRVRARLRLRDADARRRTEEAGIVVRKVGRRTQFDLPCLVRPQALRKPGAARYDRRWSNGRYER